MLFMQFFMYLPIDKSTAFSFHFNDKYFFTMIIIFLRKEGKPPLVCFPSFSFAEIHPFVALSNDKVISPLASGDQRYARLIGGRFLEKATQKLLKNNVLLDLKLISLNTDVPKRPYALQAFRNIRICLKAVPVP